MFWSTARGTAAGFGRTWQTVLGPGDIHVYTPTCTGCGERLHLTNPDVGLETHITDITQVIEFEDLDEVILVGHSFSGITITGVADRMRDESNGLFFLTHWCLGRVA